MYVLTLELDNLEVYAGLEAHFDKDPDTGMSGYFFGEGTGSWMTKSEAIEFLIMREGRIQGVKQLDVA